MALDKKNLKKESFTKATPAPSPAPAAPAPKTQEMSQYSYFLKNKSKTMLMVNTFLQDKNFKQKKHLSFCLLNEAGEFLIKPMGGYSAKEIFESKGILKLEQKGLISRREKKQLLMVTK